MHKRMHLLLPPMNDLHIEVMQITGLTLERRLTGRDGISAMSWQSLPLIPFQLHTDEAPDWTRSYL